ncbi:hypothetical protein Tco_1488844 [Tanacetum coccineum]
MGKHGHKKRKSTREAKDSKPKPEKVKLQSTMGQQSQLKTNPQSKKPRRRGESIREKGIYTTITHRSNTKCHITDCHAGNPCVHKLDPTNHNHDPIIGNNQEMILTGASNRNQGLEGSHKWTRTKELRSLEDARQKSSSKDNGTYKFDLKSAIFSHMNKKKSANKNTTNYRLYHALMEALIADEDAMDKEVADKVNDHKRKHDS